MKMKNKFAVYGTVIALFVAIGCGSSSTGNDSTAVAGTVSIDTTKMKTGDVYYQCEMHSEVLSEKAGTCPKCGMDLTKMEKK